MSLAQAGTSVPRIDVDMLIRVFELGETWACCAQKWAKRKGRKSWD